MGGASLMQTTSRRLELPPSNATLQTRVPPVTGHCLSLSMPRKFRNCEVPFSVAFVFGSDLIKIESEIAKMNW